MTNVDQKLLSETDPECEFVQVPPQTNQSARMNACWVVPAEKEIIASPAPPDSDPKSKSQRLPSSLDDNNDDDSKPPAPFWRATHDWESPIWGWVVVNHTNYGLQFFLPSGAFYREVRCGDPTGALASPEWLPFQKADALDGPNRGRTADGSVAARQLAQLVQTVATTEGYLLQFMAMLMVSADTETPNAYSEFQTAFISKPFALVNTGWSLELATPAQEKSLVGDSVVDKTLYQSSVTRAGPGLGGGDLNHEYDAKDYRLPVKLGGQGYGLDGLVAYFKPLKSPKDGDALDLSKLYTHFPPHTTRFDVEISNLSRDSNATNATDIKTDDIIVQISPSNYPRLTPYYIDPTNTTHSDHIDISNEQLCVFGAIVDPFLPVHGFSGILPIKELMLPKWVWQMAMENLSAFFHAGPVLVASDVPDFDASRQLARDKLPPKADDNKHEAGVSLPSGSLGEWAWLQPYSGMPQDGKNPESSTSATDVAGDRLPYSIDPVDKMAHLERGPYTALEGYLKIGPRAGKEDNGLPKP